MQNIILKKIVLFIFFVCFFAQIDAQICKEQEAIISSERKGYSQFVNQKTFSTSGNNIDLKYHRLEWTIDPDTNYIKGVVTSFFSPTDSLTQITFDLSSVLTVDSVIYHSSSLTFSHLSGDVLQINFTSALPPNKLDSITVFYQGSPKSTGFGSFIKSKHDSMPIIWTLSEPFGAKDWWPCKQNLNDKIDSIDIYVTTPQKYRVASNGLLISEIINGNNKVFHWKHRYPIAAYLVGIAVTNYASYSDYAALGNDTLEILNYVYPEHLADTQKKTPDIIPVMQLYDSLFGHYPFIKEKYGHAEFGWGGGMEHQTMSFVTDFGHELISHELAHQWFGDKITCGNWEDIWLNEGFATYLTGLTYEHLFNGIYWNVWKKNQMDNIIKSTDGSVKVDDTTSVKRIFDGRLSYAKGAMLLHMLRWKMGDSIFFTAIRNYIHDTTLAYKYAQTPDLKKHLEAASGQDLTDFFSDWYSGEGYPSYQIEWSQDSTNMLHLSISQKQSHPSVSFFEMPLPIKIKNATSDTLLIFNHTFSGQSFSAALNFKAVSLLFDPDLWILSGHNVVYNPNELPANFTITVFPNPFNTAATVEIYGLNLNVKGMYLMLYDMQGKEVKKIIIQNPKFQIDRVGLQSGMYFYKLFDGNNFIAKGKLAIE